MKLNSLAAAICIAACLVPASAYAQGDCNNNAVADTADIDNGTAEDCNGNGIPDSCDLAPTPIFMIDQSFPVGTTPLNLINADLNSDGVVDLVAVNRSGGSVSVLVNRGTSFTPLTFVAGNLPESVAAGDFNSDGLVDLATANAGSNDVSILLNTGNDPGGNPTFAAAVPVAVGSSPTFILALDLNADGILDLAVANRLSNNVTKLLNNGLGVFTSGGSQSVGVQPVAMTSGDFNNDGRPDLAVANFTSNNVSVLLTGTVIVSETPAIFGGPFSIVSGEFDGDGNVDLVVSNFNTSLLNLLHNNGDGTFTPSTEISGATNPVFVTAADLTRDGVIDLLVADAEGVILFSGYNNGNFFFTRRGPITGIINSIAVADYKSTGQAQVAVADEQNNNVSLLMESTTAPFSQDIPPCPGGGAACGAGACGAGVVELTLLGLIGLRFCGSPRRRTRW